MIYRILFLCFLFQSCLSEVTPLIAPKEPLREKQTPKIDAGLTFENNPEVFSLFLWPDFISWNRDKMYSPSDSYRVKLRAVMKNVIKKNDLHDDVDRKLFQLSTPIFDLMNMMDELECYILDEGDEGYERCEELQADLDKLLDQQDKLTQQKSLLVKDILESLDADMRKPKNWLISVNDKTESVFILDQDRVRIEVKKLSPQKNNYSTEDGSIQNVLYDRDQAKLSFVIREKDAYQNYTGNEFFLDLDQSFYLYKLRFQGDLLYRDKNGSILRRGRAKIDFPKIDF